MDGPPPLTAGPLALLQVTGVIRCIGQHGRQVMRELYPPLTLAEAAQTALEELPQPVTPDLPVTQTVVYTGEPLVIAAYNVPALVRLAQQAEGVAVAR